VAIDYLLMSNYGVLPNLLPHVEPTANGRVGKSERSFLHDLPDYPLGVNNKVEFVAASAE
jgi:hypothetical protein